MKEILYKYLELTKPKVTLLNLLVGATCFVLASFQSLNFVNLIVFCVAGYLACGGSCALNCFYDQDTDRVMQRTSKRAIPSGLITPFKALAFGLALTGTGVVAGSIFLNPLTGFIMLLGASIYVIVYTIVLKRTSSWNVVIGGFAGCCAAISGWTAAANAISLLPILVSTVDFLWTPGHLWGLAMKKLKEYKNAGIPMLPVTVGIKKTARIVLAFDLAAIAFSLVLPLLGVAGMLYATVAGFAGSWFLLQNGRLVKFPSETNGFRLFLSSMPYLTFLMIGLILDRLLLFL